MSPGVQVHCGQSEVQGVGVPCTMYSGLVVFRCTAAKVSEVLGVGCALHHVFMSPGVQVHCRCSEVGGVGVPCTRFPCLQVFRRTAAEMSEVLGVGCAQQCVAAWAAG
jgi:hypothetical protein